MTIAPGSYPVPSGSTLIVPGVTPPPNPSVPLVPKSSPIPAGAPIKTWDFTTMTALPPEFVPSWFGNTGPPWPNETVMDAHNVSVGPAGVGLRLNGTAQTGGIISSNPSDGQHGTNQGFAIAPTPSDPVFRQTLVTVSAAALQNWLASWATGQSWPSTGECDDMEYFGNPQIHMIYAGPNGQPANQSITNHAPWAPGDHTIGVYWLPGACTFYYDGVNLGTLKQPGALQSPLYIVHENSITSGKQGVESTYFIKRIDIWNGAVTAA